MFSLLLLLIIYTGHISNIITACDVLFVHVLNLVRVCMLTCVFGVPGNLLYVVFGTDKLTM